MNSVQTGQLIEVSGHGIKFQSRSNRGIYKEPSTTAGKVGFRDLFGRTCRQSATVGLRFSSARALSLVNSARTRLRARKRRQYILGSRDLHEHRSLSFPARRIHHLPEEMQSPTRRVYSRTNSAARFRNFTPGEIPAEISGNRSSEERRMSLHLN